MTARDDTADPLASAFDPAGIELDTYANWESAGHFAPQGNGTPYCIMIPPPNVTGSLHMGHAFQHTIMDTLIRYNRMRGNRTLWQVGTDHAGISTQMIVERQLLAQDLRKEDLGRDAFVDKVWDWRDTSGRRITEQLRRMGSSPDWSRERFTLDEGFSRAVLEVFVRLHEDGLIYRGERLVNWDPVLQSAISDLEVESEEENGHLWHFRYPLADGRTTTDGKDHLIVATTRPETMLGDTAVAVHPEDERYSDLIGAFVELPLVGRRIPVIADDYVDREFGSGCVKITPAHDFNDYEMGQRHDLPMINIFTPAAAINDEAPEAYRDLDRVEARKQIVADFESAGLLEKIEDHKLAVPRGDRSGAIVEPYLTWQWYVKIAPLAEPAIAAVEDGRIEFTPKQYENLYFSWMRDIKDWCISRQQWWGHRIPAWYDDDGNIYVGRDEAEVRAKHNLDDRPLRQDEDVLDTWFSSALWTFGTLGWPEKTQELELYHPTDILVTGFDIIFFWVARMIMMTLRFMDEVPFRKVFVTGLVCDAEGRKMSKSKGNGLDPLDIIDGIELDALVDKRTVDLMQPQLARKIEKATRKDYPDGIPAFGTDAVRFTFCALASTGRVLSFDTNRVAGYRNFCNKLWNAARFVLENTEGHDLTGTGKPGPADRWIRSRFQHMLGEVERAIETCRFDLLARSVYEFIWDEYCAWYLEIAKPVLWDENADPAEQLAVRQTLIEVLEGALRVAHPMIPFVTESLWARVAATCPGTRVGDGASIMTQPWPAADASQQDTGADADIAWLKDVVTALRKVRDELQVPPRDSIQLLLAECGESDLARLNSTRRLVARLAKVEDIQVLENAEGAPPATTSLVGSMKVMVPLAGLVDVDAERERLNREIEKRQQELQRVEGKLANDKFVSKAPAEVVDKERAKATAARDAIAALTEQREALAAL